MSSCRRVVVSLLLSSSSSLGLSDTLGSSWSPLAIRPCSKVGLNLDITFKATSSPTYSTLCGQPSLDWPNGHPQGVITTYRIKMNCISLIRINLKINKIRPTAYDVGCPIALRKTALHYLWVAANQPISDFLPLCDFWGPLNHLTRKYGRASVLSREVGNQSKCYYYR